MIELLFFGLCFFGWGDCQDENTDVISIPTTDCQKLEGSWVSVMDGSTCFVIHGRNVVLHTDECLSKTLGYVNGTLMQFCITATPYFNHTIYLTENFYTQPPEWLKLIENSTSYIIYYENGTLKKILEDENPNEVQIK